MGRASRAVAIGKQEKTVVARAPRKPSAGKKIVAKPNAVKTAAVSKGLAKQAPARLVGAKAVTAKPAAASRSQPAKAARPTARSTAVTKPAGTVAVTPAIKRRAASKASAHPPRARPATARKPPQVFTVSHFNEADFKPDGLRAYALYRDLGIAAASAGLCQAHVIRFVPPTTDEVRKRHTHAVDLQLVYVLKGWMKNEFEGLGEQMMSTGSCWLQPSGVKHTVLEYSADCEVLEIVVPADFKTQELG